MAYKIQGVIRLDNSGNANLGIASATEFDGKVSDKAITEQTDGAFSDVTGVDELLLYDTDTGDLLRVTVDEFVKGAGISTVGILTSDTFVSVGASLIPDTNITYDLGSPTQRFRDIYLEGNTIYLGDTQLSSDNIVTSTSGIITAAGFDSVGVITAGSFHGDASALDNISASGLKFGLEYDYSSDTNVNTTQAGFFRSNNSNTQFSIHTTDRNGLSQASFFNNIRFGFRYTVYIEYDGGAAYLTGVFSSVNGLIYKFRNGSLRGDLPGDNTDCKLMIMGNAGLSVRTIDSEVTGIASVSTLSGFGTNAITVTSDLNCGIITAQYVYGGFSGKIYNNDGNPIFDSETASFGGDVYGNVFSNATTGISSFHDITSSGIITATELDVRQGVGIITANYLYGGFSGKIYNNQGNPIFDSETASFGGIVFGDVVAGSSGISTFKDLIVSGVTTMTDHLIINDSNNSATEYNFNVRSSGSSVFGVLGNGAVLLGPNTAAPFIASNDHHATSKKYVDDAISAGTTSLSIPDDGEITFGDSDDFKVYHDGDHTYLDDQGQGNLKLRTNNFVLSNANESKTLARFTAGGPVQLYYDNSLIFQTNDGGVVILNDIQTVRNINSSGIVTSGGYEFSAGGPTWTRGTGSPEAVVTAPVGSLYSRTDGGAGTALYVKESGTGNTGWVGK